MLNELRAAVPAKHVEGVKSSFHYVHRVGVPRDPPLAARSILSGVPELALIHSKKLVRSK
jgi:hypothetical protein